MFVEELVEQMWICAIKEADAKAGIGVGVYMRTLIGGLDVVVVGVAIAQLFENYYSAKDETDDDYESDDEF